MQNYNSRAWPGNRGSRRDRRSSRRVSLTIRCAVVLSERQDRDTAFDALLDRGLGDSLGRRRNESDLLVAAIETHQALLGLAPCLVAADAAFYSLRNEAAAKAKGVKRVCIPNHST